MTAQQKIEAAPLSYQAEVLRGQLCDDVNQRYWRARTRLLQAYADKKDQIDRDFNRMSSADFLAKYKDAF